jgi:glycine/D-amino acid oxidase-like deaminating enzyme
LTQAIHEYDAIVIGAGFFGAVLADYLSNRPGFAEVAVIEMEQGALKRSSSRNQARIHQGYHYPRSLATAQASRRSYSGFKEKWPSAVFTDFRHLYGIARHGSKVSPEQFSATMRAIGAPLRELGQLESGAVFDSRRIEKAYEVVEEAFDFRELAAWASEVLEKPGLDVFFGETVQAVESTPNNVLVRCKSGLEISSKLVFNVTYSGLGGIQGIGEELEGQVSHELTEMNLVSATQELSELAITVMDGPFFSLMPYPSMAPLQTLSHVRYTPLVREAGLRHKSPYRDLDDLDPGSFSFNSMTRDASRFVPALSEVQLRGTIREVKTVLIRSSHDDSRPILFFKHRDPRVFSILGGKIDNVFDMIERLDMENLN